MRCFYHSDVEAVGLCKNCHRGLCRACAVEITNGLACRDRCEKEVLALDRTFRRARAATGPAAVLFTGVGAIFVIVGLLSLPSGLLILVVGGFLLAFGALQLLSGRSKSSSPGASA